MRTKIELTDGLRMLSNGVKRRKRTPNVASPECGFIEYYLNLNR